MTSVLSQIDKYSEYLTVDQVKTIKNYFISPDEESDLRFTHRGVAFYRGDCHLGYGFFLSHKFIIVPKHVISGLEIRDQPPGTFTLSGKVGDNEVRTPVKPIVKLFFEVPIQTVDFSLLNVHVEGPPLTWNIDNGRTLIIKNDQNGYEPGDCGKLLTPARFLIGAVGNPDEDGLYHNLVLANAYKIQTSALEAIQSLQTFEAGPKPHRPDFRRRMEEDYLKLASTFSFSFRTQWTINTNGQSFITLGKSEEEKEFAQKWTEFYKLSLANQTLDRARQIIPCLQYDLDVLKRLKDKVTNINGNQVAFMPWKNANQPAAYLDDHVCWMFKSAKGKYNNGVLKRWYDIVARAAATDPALKNENEHYQYTASNNLQMKWSLPANGEESVNHHPLVCEFVARKMPDSGFMCGDTHSCCRPSHLLLSKQNINAFHTEISSVFTHLTNDPNGALSLWNQLKK